MDIQFYTYVGEAGDLQHLLVGESQNGYKISRLCDRTYFPLFSLRRAKKKIMKEFEILTGQKPVEAPFLTPPKEG